MSKINLANEANSLNEVIDIITGYVMAEPVVAEGKEIEAKQKKRR